MALIPPDGWLVPAPAQKLEATDAFAGLDATVVDFWRWAYSDLRDNTARGVLAEFLVAAALGRTGERRKGWDNFDVLTSTGVRVEVKASGYLQSWAQQTHSKLNFGRVAARSWDENTNTFGADPEVRADVFVFAVQTCKDPADYDALNVAQWAFYVVPAARVRECGFKSVSISWVRRYAEPVGFSALAAAIEAAAVEQPAPPPTPAPSPATGPVPAATAPSYVYGNQTKPRMRHRPDCPHQTPGVTTFRRATAQEMQALPECRDCAR